MQKLMGLMRRAIEKYEMIEEGDKIALGISGGKDSVAMLVAMSGLREYLGIKFDISAITLDPGFSGKATDYTAIEELCERIKVPYIIKRTEIGSIVFETRHESNPCSLCARMRRGCLHDSAKELKCNKIALGHHYDDAIETFIMNLFNEGRVGCFQPVTYLTRKDLTLIRPMVFAEESLICSSATNAHLPIVKSICPVDGSTNREWTKNWIRQMDKEHNGFKKRLFGAMERSHISGF